MKHLLLILFFSAGTGNGFIVTRVPKTNHNYIQFKTTEDILPAAVANISSFFMAKKGFLLCDINEEQNTVKLETLQRVTTENVNDIMLHLGYHVDAGWTGANDGENK